MTEKWSLHPEILPDEAVTSWIKRIAQLHLNDIASVLGMRSLRAFMIDKLDIDPPNDVINHLSSRTGIPQPRITENALINYDSNFPHSNSPTTGNLRQGFDDLKYFKFMPFMQNHRIRTQNNTSFRYCPKCLNEDIPYYRWFWRLAYYIVCLKHEILLHEVCFNCNAPVQFLNENNNLEVCHKCNESYSNAPIIHQSTTIPKILHDAFMNQSSPINNLSPQRFLGIFWTIHNTILIREDEYFEKLMNKYSISYTQEDLNFQFMRYTKSYKVVWKIIHELDSYDYLLPCTECN
ncbi:MAG: TniQ family protein, partial [Candidatus Heimdallarchaeota archaeon]|nr:TniQ family protein [Candidatus Heimdallarchaeota archaeon]